ncbi:alpha/beta hydrolase fold domain-containing protein [Dinoroseobacter sp. S375]|uniref:alpha/beta hydrolase fold domain-containing protein n=1 Tax=Dinoroseobacter sp. S375 TaxID=3415136 RepID=UPI003C7AC288
MTRQQGPEGMGDRLWPLFARYVQRPTLAFTPSQTLLRAIFDATVFLGEKRCKGVAQGRTDLGGVPTMTLHPEDATGGRLLYLHGGGFTIGSARSHQHMVSHIARAAGCTAWLPDYRLAPQHPFPAAPEDVLAAYGALSAEGPVMVAGDSAGGCLALGLLHWAARAGLPPPAALALLSPIGHLDLEAGGFQTRLETEILIPERWGRNTVAAYLCGHDPGDPYASPLAAPLPAAPPTLIQYAEGEALARDALASAEALRAAGADVAVEGYPGMPHVWQIHAGRSRSADRAVANLGAFLRAHGGPS